MSSGLYSVAKNIGYASYIVQLFNVVADGLGEVHDKWGSPGKCIAAFIIDPNLISFFSSGLSFLILQDFYARLYQGNPMGVFTVTSQSPSDNGDTVCERYGVIADSAEDAVQSGVCHQFASHVEGCQEDYFTHGGNVLNVGVKCDGSDPVIVQQTLFGGWSATSLQLAFFLGCVLRFYDALTTLFLETVAPQIQARWPNAFLKYNWVQKVICESAILRGYQIKDIIIDKSDAKTTGIVEDKSGVYNAEKWKICCCPGKTVIFNIPELLERLGWGAKVLSCIASDCLFAVLTMTSLHVSVEEGCVSLNTEMGFSFLTAWVYFFITVVGLSFGIILMIVIYHVGEAALEKCGGCEIRDTTCYFTIFAGCIYVLATVSIIGFIFNTVSLIWDGDLSAQGCAGIMLEIFGMVGEIAEGFQDEEKKEEKKEAAKNLKNAVETDTYGNRTDG